MAFTLLFSDGFQSLKFEAIDSFQQVYYANMPAIIEFATESDTGHFEVSAFDQSEVLLLTVTVHRMASLERLIAIFMGKPEKPAS